MPAKRKKWMMAPAEFLLRATQGHSHLVPPTELTWTGPWDHNAGCLDVLILVGLQLTPHLPSLHGQDLNLGLFDNKSQAIKTRNSILSK